MPILLIKLAMSPVKYIKLQESQCLMLVASAVIGAVVVVIID